MENTVKRRAPGNMLIFLACVAYSSSYVLRYTFVVSMAGLISRGVVNEVEAGFIDAAFTLAYGGGQILSGFLGDRLKPERMIFFGLMVGVMANLAFPLCSSVPYYLVVWGINGLSQAMLWPPLLRICAARLQGKKYGFCMAMVTAANNIAMLLMYVLMPLVLGGLGWKWVFVLAPAYPLLIATLWLIFNRRAIDTCPEVKVEKVTSSGKKVKLLPLIAASGLITVFVAISCQGFLRDGVTHWVPSYLSATYNINTENSILYTSVVALVSAGCAYFFTWLFNRFFKSEIVAAGVLFIVAGALAGILFPTWNLSAVTSLIFAAVIVSIMHGINIALVTFIPRRFVSLGCSSTISGITNAFTYLGSTIASPLSAAVSVSLGWQYVILLWAGICALGLVSLIISFRPYKRFLSGLK